ncbi:MAG TPA: family 78 glycoside hydrolase catalytic domain [Clostridiales bacterium]|nr:family 78 glycoside hydrolase catalytic domain [Clostridiales bacterium]
MNWKAKWITAHDGNSDICPVFRCRWDTLKPIAKAELVLTALGVYEACLNGKRVSNYVLAPGWTAYEKRLQYQSYDITGLLAAENELLVTVGKGWYSSRMPGETNIKDMERRMARPRGLLGEIRLLFADGTQKTIATGTGWEYGESPVRFSEIYDGEAYDASFITQEWKACKLLKQSNEILIPQEGEIIREHEIVYAKSVFTTPAGETVVDFGQEVTGYAEFTIDAKFGDKVKILHGEVLDKDGNFYNANYRSAKAEINYICCDGIQTWHPRLTFFGFRYLKLVEFPGIALPEQFKAIAVYSDILKTGQLKCSDDGLNQLFSNIFWSQKGNFLDVPTDCPQRDERLGWTGDAQVFAKAACYNYDVETFYIKWLNDLRMSQRENGGIPTVIPDYLPEFEPSAAWGDASAIMPWQLYMTYGNVQILRNQFDSMKKWVDYITNCTNHPFLWTGGVHLGDWLGLDAPSGSFKGSSRDDFIATVYYANSTRLLAKTGRILNEDITEYEELYQNIVKTFRKTYTEYQTETEYVLAIWFGLEANPEEAADKLAKIIKEDGYKLRTGFLGTAYVLHVLSKYGHTKLAYTLLLRKEYPSWLFSVGKGATTIWEHWDGIMEDGSFWSTDMNSFNHYAYGAVADWVYEQAAGIQPVEDAPGFVKVRIAPKPDTRLHWLKASFRTRHGRIVSKWECKEDAIKYELTTPVPAYVIIDGKEAEVGPGSYIFWGNI